MASWTARFAKQNGGAEARVGAPVKAPPAVKPANRFGVLGEEDEEVVPVSTVAKAPHVGILGRAPVSTVAKEPHVGILGRAPVYSGPPAVDARRSRPAAKPAARSGGGHRGYHDAAPVAAPVVPDVMSSKEFPALGGRAVSTVAKPLVPPVSFAAKAAEAARLPTPPRPTKPIAPDAPKKTPTDLWNAPECDWDATGEDYPDYPDMDDADDGASDGDGEGAW